MHRLQNARRNPGASGRLTPATDEPQGPSSVESTYLGRFAPTPSGPLHLGSLLTALASYLDAKSQGGLWRLRIDDLDAPRTKPGARDTILRQLERLELFWDGPVMDQQGRLEIYSEGIRTLQRLGLLYACDCSRRDRGAGEDLSLSLCPGKCLDRNIPFVSGKTALRIRVPQRIFEIDDRIKGLYRQSLAHETGDFVIFRKDQTHTYHLATVLDDEALGITHVIRGEDLMAATPAQNFLKEIFCFKIPLYAHTPLMLDPTGRKLSKSGLSPAETDDTPKRLLWRLLDYLNHRPPVALQQAPPQELLDWARSNWQLEKLRGIGTISLKPLPEGA